MIPRQFDDIEQADIQALVDNQVPEGRTLEYKETLPGNSDADKKEFLADVSSFANAAGGDIIYGIREARDAEGKSTGLPEEAVGLENINVDEQVLRLESTIRTGLDPRVPGIRLRGVNGFPQGPVLILRIPQSWASPHMVTFKNASRFYSRNSAGKYPLDAGEIRAAFNRYSALSERIKAFRDERLGKIVAAELPVLLLPHAKLVLHLMPTSSFMSEVTLDLSNVAQVDNYLKAPMDPGRVTDRFNLDGYLTINAITGEGPSGYLQLFRNGILEAVDSYVLQPRTGGSYIQTVYLEEKIIEGTNRYWQLLNEMGVNAPISVFVTLLGVRGYKIATGSVNLTGRTFDLDRDTVTLPDVLLEQYPASLVETGALLKPIFDALWQAGGWDRCYHYNDEGSWERPR
jgi:hypothetical protein